MIIYSLKICIKTICMFSSQWRWPCNVFRPVSTNIWKIIRFRWWNVFEDNVYNGPKSILLLVWCKSPLVSRWHVVRQTNNRNVVGSRPTKVVCITVLTGNRLGWTVRCGRPPLLLLSCRKLDFRLSALMDSDLAWVNGKNGRQSWCHADAFQRSIISGATYHVFYHFHEGMHKKQFVHFYSRWPWPFDLKFALPFTGVRSNKWSQITQHIGENLCLPKISISS